MNKLPERFPEHIIMYKILTKKILDLKKEKNKLQDKEFEELQSKIEKYELERAKIKSVFPEKFFENYTLE
jgi:uncharacterized protein YlxW (UPF0749 family)